LGIISIMLVFHERPDLAAILVIVAMLLDGLDGRIARALKVQSEFGKELDSLSDVVSFGVAPALIVYWTAFQHLSHQPLVWMLTAVFPACGALRLARFNAQGNVAGSFVGLPIPAAGGILATLALFGQQIKSPAFLMGCMLALSFLMVSTVRYPSFKMVRLSRRAWRWVPFALAGAVVLAVRFPGQLSRFLFVPLVLYALWGIKQNVDALAYYVFRRRRREVEDGVNREA